MVGHYVGGDWCTRNIAFISSLIISVVPSVQHISFITTSPLALLFAYQPWPPLKNGFPAIIAKQYKITRTAQETTTITTNDVGRGRGRGKGRADGGPIVTIPQDHIQANRRGKQERGNNPKDKASGAYRTTWWCRRSGSCTGHAVVLCVRHLPGRPTSQHRIDSLL